MIYFKFENRTTKIRKDKSASHLSRFILSFLSFFIPKANPDFDGFYKYVNTWYIEYEDVEQVALREVGLDKDNKVIVKAPYYNNYGYWTDNDLTIETFALHFNIEYINKGEFENVWNRF